MAPTAPNTARKGIIHWDTGVVTTKRERKSAFQTGLVQIAAIIVKPEMIPMGIISVTSKRERNLVLKSGMDQAVINIVLQEMIHWVTIRVIN